MRLRQRVGRAVRVAVLALTAACSVASARASSGHGRPHPFKVQGGVLTVDGMTARHGLTLGTANFRYLFLYVPGEGTAIVAQQPFEGASPQKMAFKGNALTIVAGGRRLQLTSTTPMRSHVAYVRFERGMVPGLRTPAVAFGEAAMVPAVWPGEDTPVETSRLRRVRGRRALRSGKLCRPSPRGRELCAVVHEVVYKPW